jgi:predicted PurR-regulated permease PerM
MPLKSFFKKLKRHVSEAKKQAKKKPVRVHKAPPHEKPKMIEFSVINIAKATFIVALVGLLAFLVYQIRAILLLFFIALLFSAALDPTVDSWQKRWKMPRWLSVILIYLLVFIVLGVFISNLIPLIASQLTELALKLQDIITNLATGGNRSNGVFDWLGQYSRTFFTEVNQDLIVEQLQTSLATIGETLSGAAGNVFRALIAISNGVFNFLLILVLTFFMVVDERGIDEFVLSLFPSRYATYISDKVIGFVHNFFWPVLLEF